MAGISLLRRTAGPEQMRASVPTRWLWICCCGVDHYQRRGRPPLRLTDCGHASCNPVALAGLAVVRLAAPLTAGGVPINRRAQMLLVPLDVSRLDRGRSTGKALASS
jgi:hypothetical protein